jgi:hypothetical protein
MTRLVTPFRVEAIFWLLLNGGLVLGIGVITDWGQRLEWPTPQVAMAPIEFAKPALVEPLQFGQADEFLEMSMRPLFVATRRPAPPPPPPEAPKPRMKKGQFRLTGITVVPEGKFAFLVEVNGNKSRVVSEGKEINGILVRRISPYEVLLSQYGDSETLVLKPAKSPGGPNPQQPAPVRPLSNRNQPPPPGAAKPEQD